MPWVRVDDHFPDHHKLAELGDLAPVGGWLALCGLAWCNRQLTDGRIPKAQVHRLASFRHVAVAGVQVDAEALAEALVRVGLWTVSDDGCAYVIHDYHHYQPSKADVLAERARNAARKQRHPATGRYTGNGTAGGTGGGTAGTTVGGTTPVLALSVPSAPRPRRATEGVPQAAVQNAEEVCGTGGGTSGGTGGGTAGTNLRPVPDPGTPVQKTKSVGAAAPLTAGLKAHRAHAVCGRVCLHTTQFEEFTRLSGKPDSEADAYVRQWALAVLAAWPESQAIGDDAWAFWRLRWGEAHPSTRKTRAEREAESVGARFLGTVTP